MIYCQFEFKFHFFILTEFEFELKPARGIWPVQTIDHKGGIQEVWQVTRNGHSSGSYNWYCKKEVPQGVCWTELSVIAWVMFGRLLLLWHSFAFSSTTTVSQSVFLKLRGIKFWKTPIYHNHWNQRILWPKKIKKLFPNCLYLWLLLQFVDGTNCSSFSRFWVEFKREDSLSASSKLGLPC